MFRKTSAIIGAVALLAVGALLGSGNVRTWAQVNVACYMDQGAAAFHIGSGCTQSVESGGVINVKSGGALQVAGVDKTSILTNALSSTSAAKKVIAGQASTATASDTVVTGLTTVTSCSAQLDDAPTTDPEAASCSIGDQAGSPAAGSVLIKTWKTFGGTPAAATTFSKKVNWTAFGS